MLLTLSFLLSLLFISISVISIIILIIHVLFIVSFCAVLCVLVVSANLRNTFGQFYTGKRQSPQISAKLLQELRRNIAKN